MRGLDLCGDPFPVSAGSFLPSVRNEYLYLRSLRLTPEAGWIETAYVPNNPVHNISYGFENGIQRGHMELHARNIAASVGATGPIVDEIVNKMFKEKNISMSYAKELFSIVSKKTNK